MILEFQNENRFLSNFYYCPVRYNGLRASSIEHAYQASKATNLSDAKKILACSSPGSAKRMGRKIIVRDDWDKIKIDIMYMHLNSKFSIPGLKLKLINTEDDWLIEGNRWGDQFWGFSRGSGKNILGLLLMKLRAVLNEDSLSEITKFDGRMTQDMKNYAHPSMINALKAKGF